MLGSRYRHDTCTFWRRCMGSVRMVQMLHMEDPGLKGRQRVGQAKTAFIELSNILTNQSLSFKIRKRVLDDHIGLVVTYGSGFLWIINKQSGKCHLLLSKIWFIRKIHRLLYAEGATADEALEGAAKKRILTNNFCNLPPKKKKLSNVFWSCHEKAGDRKLGNN